MIGMNVAHRRRRGGRCRDYRRDIRFERGDKHYPRLGGGTGVGVGSECGRSGELVAESGKCGGGVIAKQCDLVGGCRGGGVTVEGSEQQIAGEFWRDADGRISGGSGS